MDYTVFADLRPKQRTEDFALKVRQFISKCPEDIDPGRPSWMDLSRPYWIVTRSCRCIDCHDKTQHLLPYRTPKDWYRVRTKTRRTEVRTIIDYLPFIDLYGDEGLENERETLIAAGHELIGLYDAIIKACS